MEPTLLGKILNSGGIGVTAGAVIGFAVSWYFYRKGKLDSDNLIAELRKDNEALKDLMASSINNEIPPESETKLRRLRSLIHKLDRTIDRRTTILAFSCVASLWLGALFLCIQTDSELFGLLIVPGIPLAIGVGYALRVSTRRWIQGRRMRRVHQALSGAELTVFEVDYMNRWVDGHAWLYFKPAWILRALERTIGDRDEAISLA